MRFAHYALSAGAALVLVLSTHAQTIGSGCNADGECDSLCCSSQFGPPLCSEFGTILNGGSCTAASGCDCVSGVCVSGICVECAVNSDCPTGCCGFPMGQPVCFNLQTTPDDEDCFTQDGCDCVSTRCIDDVCAPACPAGTTTCGDPHMLGLRGQTIDWSGIDGGWYCLVTDNDASLHVNLRLTAPLPQEFPDRQLITGLSVLSEGHSLTIEVANPYNVDTDGCPAGVSPCLADGGLRATVDGKDVDDLLRSSRHEYVADGIALSASNLPVECRQFGGDKVWARMYDEMLQGYRQLTEEEKFEDWIMRFDHMAAPEWCTQYIAKHDLADLQSNHAVLKIETTAVTVRLNIGTNFQGNGELDWDGRVLPDLEFWQMDVGLHGLSTESKSLSGILGETARPVLDKDGHAVMKGYDAFRGMVEDYRVSGPLGTDFALQHTK